MSKTQLSQVPNHTSQSGMISDHEFCEQRFASQNDQVPKRSISLFHKTHSLNPLRWSIVMMIVMMGFGGYSKVFSQCITTYQPASLSVAGCEGSNENFRINYGSLPSEPTVVWQYNDGVNGWLPISGSAIIHSVTNNFALAFTRLTVNNTLLTYNGYQFRALFSGSCTQTSSVFTLSVNSPVTIITQPNDAEACNTEAGPEVFSATTSAPPTSYLWQSSSTGTAPWTNIAASNNNTLSVANPSATWPVPGIGEDSKTIYLRMRASVSGCPNVFTDIVEFRVDVAPTITSISDDTEICTTGSAVLSASIGGPATGVTWSVSPNTGTFSASNTANPVTYTNSSPGTYTITATTNANACGAASEDVIVTVSSQLPATVNAGIDRTVCANDTIHLAGMVGGPFGTGMWSATSGTFSDANSLNSIYTPSISSGTVELVLASYDPPGVCPIVRDTIVVNVNEGVTVNVGSDEAICLGDSIAVNAMMTGSVTTGMWSGGTGVFTNPSMTSTYFTPSAGGNMTLTFTSTNDGVCSSVSDDLTLTVNSIVEGAATTLIQTICAGSNTTFRKNRTTFPASPAGSVNTWLYDDGSGYKPVDLAGVTYTNTANFTQININNALVSWDYDFAVVVTSGTCLDTFFGYELIVNTPATANAGVDTTICSGATYLLPTPNFGGGASMGTWATEGDGTFASGAYTPGSADLIAGFVKLNVFTDNPAGPCPIARDTMTLSIDSIAISNYVPASLITNRCEGGNATFRVNFTADPSATVAWLYRAPAGSWADASGLGTITSPGGNTQFNMTGVLLSQNAYEFRALITAGFCSDSSDVFTLNVGEAGTVEAGAPVYICEVSTAAQLSGSFTGGYSSATWSGGAGSFSPNATTLNATYQPLLPAEAGTIVKLYLTTNNPPGGCPAIVDSVNVHVPTGITAGPDANVCHDGSITLTGAGIMAPVTSAIWSSSGNGIFSDVLGLGAAVYTPGSDDILAGTVTLTLTSQGVDPDGPGGCPNYSDKRVLTVEKLDFTSYTPASKIVNTCDGENVELSVTTSSVTTPSYQWMKAASSAGPFTNVGTDSPLLSFPADALDSGYVYKVQVSPLSGCGGTSDEFTVNINGEISISSQPVSVGPICNSTTSAMFTSVASSDRGIPSLQWQYSTTLAGTYTDISGFGANTENLALDNSFSNWPGLGGTLYLRMAATLPTCDPVYSDTITLSIDAIAPATVDAGTLASRECNASKIFVLDGTLGGTATSAMWSVSTASVPGGTFNDVNFIDATFTASDAQMFAGGVDLVLTTNDPAGVCPAVTDTVTITITNTGVVSAGDDMTVCTGATPVTIMGTNSIGGAIQWTRSGTGGFGLPTPAPTSSALSTTYSPSQADRLAGTVTLTLTRNNTAVCPSKSDAKILTISNTAGVTAGSDVTICAGSTYTLDGEYFAPATSIAWSVLPGSPNTSQTQFADVNDPDTEFTPTAAGIYTLRITSNAGLPGDCDQVLDEVKITVTGVVASAPSTPSVTGVTGSSYDGTTRVLKVACLPQTGTITATFTSNMTETPSSSLWTYRWQRSIDGGSNWVNQTGTGITNSITGTYIVTVTPSMDGYMYRKIAERASCTTVEGLPVTLRVNGRVTSWTATTGGGSVCSNTNPITRMFGGAIPMFLTGPNTDTIYIWEYQVAGSGPWIEIAGSTTSPLTISNTDPSWPAIGTTNGYRRKVTFVTPDLTNCVYISGSVTFAITNGEFANAGADQTICQNGSATLAGSVINPALAGQWSIVAPGDGTISDPFQLSGSTYTPGSNAIAAGTVTLRLTTTTTGITCGPDTDDMVITIGNGSVTATNPAGPSFVRTVCDGTNALFTVDYTSSPATLDPTSVIWEYNDGNGWQNIVGSSVAHDFPNYATGSRLRVLAVDKATQDGWDFRCSVTYAGCDAIESTFDLVINDGPTIVSTGAPYGPICGATDIELDGEYGGSATLGYWKVTTGNPMQLDTTNASGAEATYSPDAADIARGYVKFVLRSNNPSGPCPAVESDTVTVMIHELTILNITPGNRTDCDGETVSFTATWAEDDITNDSTVVWKINTNNTGWTTFNGGTVTNTAGQSVLSFTATQALSVSQFRAVITSGACSDSTAIRTLTVNGPVTFTASPVNQLNVCQNVTEMQFTGAATNSGTGTISYMWQYSNNGTTGWTNVPATEPSRIMPTLTITQANGGAAWPVIGSPTGKFYRLSANLAGCSAFYNSGVAQFTISGDLAPEANAGGDQTLCSGTAYTLSGASIGGAATSAIWTTSGTGTFDNAAAIQAATYTPGPGDAGTTVTLTLTTNEVGCGFDADQMTIMYQNQGTATVGDDVNVCIDANVGDAIPVLATVTGGITTGIWTGGAGVFADANALSTTYTPALAETAAPNTIVLTFTGTSVCAPVQSDNLSVTFNAAITISAHSIGNNTAIVTPAPHTAAGICSDGESVNFRVSHSTLPITPGSRTWQYNDDNVGNADGMTGWQAVPSPNTASTTTTQSRLTLTSSPSLVDSTEYRLVLVNGDCSDTSDVFIIRINHTDITPLADIDICASETSYNIAPIISNSGTAAANYQWQYLNGGTFSAVANSVTGYNTASLTPDSGDAAIYWPAPGDTVTYRLRVQRPGTSCVFYDTIAFTRSLLVTVNAGADFSGCDNGPIQLNGTVAGPATFMWNDGGAGGTFNNASLPNATYSNNIAGTYNLALVSSDPVGDCVAVSDTVVVTIDAAPVVTLGPDVTVCMAGGATPVSLTGTLSGSATSGTWSTSPGSGIFADGAMINTTYTPSAADINTNQFARLIFTSNANGGCIADKDTIEVTIGNGIVLSSYTPGGATAGTTSVCNGGNTSFSVSYDATLLATHQWQVNDGSGWVNLPVVATSYGIGAWTVVSTDNSVTLNLTGLGVAANGLLFQVVVTDRGCSVPFGAFTLNVNGPLTFTTHPENVSVCESAESANFSAVVTNGGAGTVTYQWQYFNGTIWVNVPNTVAGYNGLNLFLTNAASFWPTAGNSVNLRLNATVPLCGTTTSNVATLTRTNVSCDALIDLIPTNFITSGTGITAGQSANVVMRVLNTGSLPTTGIVQFRVYKMGSTFSVGFNNTLTSMMVGFVNLPVTNTMWTINSSNALYHTITSNAPMVINPAEFVNIGITITATGTAGQMSTLRQQITPGTGGGETPSTNNNKTLILTIN